ncbi:peptidase C26 [Calothrix sp. NIES-4071]|nr:peptidase C26 [Calothrix sp. NIES-4071]BAZ57733.1 peptidase C26 [Calothrix sp. NIES-4105]
MNELTKPTIGITTFNQNQDGQYHIKNTFVEAVRRCGGLPILLPPGQSEESAAILEVVDGLIFSGGGDLDPATYNGSLHPAISDVDHTRDAFELKLLNQGLNTDIPLLGVCRGVAVMAVSCGASLVAHIPSEFGELVAHTGESEQSVKHLVEINPQSHLALIMEATSVEVESMHHQSVRTLPTGWRLAARSIDGVVEAIEYEYHPWAIGVQWHPELAIDNPQQLRIFQAFVEAARARKIRNQNKRNQAGFYTRIDSSLNLI